jgi:hypothetical protein
MSRYQITQHGFPVGDRLIPNGTVIDTDAQDDWSKLARGLAPPLNAQPLDQAAFDKMKSVYPEHTRWIVTGPGVRR